MRSLPVNVTCQELVNDHQRAQREAEEHSKKVGKCSHHPEVDGQYYCTVCEQIACARCVLPDGMHYGHHAVTIDEGLRLVGQEYRDILNAVRESVVATLDAVRNRKVLEERVRDAALRTAGNANEDINSIMRDLEHVRVELASSVQRGAKLVLAEASDVPQLEYRAKVARNATKFCATTTQFLESATLTQLLTQKDSIIAECNRLISASSQHGGATSNVEHEIGTLVDNRFVSQLAALKRGARTFLADEMEVCTISAILPGFWYSVLAHPVVFGNRGARALMRAFFVVHKINKTNAKLRNNTNMTLRKLPKIVIFGFCFHFNTDKAYNFFRPDTFSGCIAM